MHMYLSPDLHLPYRKHSTSKAVVVVGASRMGQIARVRVGMYCTFSALLRRYLLPYLSVASRYSRLQTDMG